MPSSLPMTAAVIMPSAARAAPVSVAMSTIASTPSSLASAIASAMTRRPSASVLTTSMVRPLRAGQHVPELVAEPDGMLSVQAR